MSSIFNTDIDGAEEGFLAKVTQTLDGSLTTLPDDVEARLFSARNAAMVQTRVPGSPNSLATEADSNVASTFGDQEIPAPIRVRLDAIRATAMQRAGAAPQRQQRWWTRLAPQGFVVPASAFASICTLVTTLAIFNFSAPPETMPLAVADSSLALASTEEIELYENLEFYQWLADNGL